MDPLHKTLENIIPWHFSTFFKSPVKCHEGEHVGSGSCAACYAVVGGSYFYRGFACPTCQQVAMGFTMGFFQVSIGVPPENAG